MMTYPKKFMNMMEVHNFLQTINPEYDASKSATLPIYSFATKDGINHFGRHFQDYVTQLKTVAEIPVLLAGSFVQGYITLNFEVDPKDLVVPKKETIKKSKTKTS